MWTQQAPNPLLGIGMRAAAPERRATVERSFVHIEILDPLEGLAEFLDAGIGAELASGLTGRAVFRAVETASRCRSIDA